MERWNEFQMIRNKYYKILLDSLVCVCVCDRTNWCVKNGPMDSIMCTSKIDIHTLFRP